VAFVLAGLSPLLRRLNRRWRTLMTILILVWFVVITRIEPSVVRAALMAGAAYLSVAMGRPTRTLRLIALTVFAAIAADPLLAWSVGYFMSVGATLGLCLGAEKLEKIIRGPQWLARLLSATLSAQFGVIPVVIFVFGVPSVFGIVANVLAVPIAGLVMLIGLPLGLFAGVIENLGRTEFATLLMWPVQVGVRWVWWVAEIFARLNVSPVFNLGLWIAVLVVLLALRHRSARV
jgi:competence protein ComEC